jgi:hypothetical protein
MMVKVTTVSREKDFSFDLKKGESNVEKVNDGKDVSKVSREKDFETDYMYILKK